MKNNTIAKLITEKALDKGRYIVAIAGPPASGKSTLAQKLREKIAVIAPETNPICVAMDGFHLDNSVLKKMGLLARKGAPTTFDAKGFIDLINTIRTNKIDVQVPEFDRALDRVVEGKTKVTSENKIVIVEGNYVLVEEDPWSDLQPLFDLPIMLLPKTKTLEKRLIDRWLDNGHSPDAAKARAYSNDIPNAKYVLANSAYVDLTFEEVES